jgi:hypothetical protein
MATPGSGTGTDPRVICHADGIDWFKDKKGRLWGKDMNRFTSYQNHENRQLSEGPPPQGLSFRHGGQEFFLLAVTDPPRGSSFGGGSLHRT